MNNTEKLNKVLKTFKGIPSEIKHDLVTLTEAQRRIKKELNLDLTKQTLSNWTKSGVIINLSKYISPHITFAIYYYPQIKAVCMKSDRIGIDNKAISKLIKNS